MTPRAPPSGKRMMLDDLITHSETEGDWSEVARQLHALLDAEEKELLPALDRAEARGMVQEVRYLRNRCAELGRMQRPRSALPVFVAEIRAHAHRTERFGFDFFRAFVPTRQSSSE